MRLPLPVTLTAVAAVGTALPAAGQQRDWPQHSLERPRPPVVTPSIAQSPVLPPSDALVLLDGRGLSRWRAMNDSTQPAPWKMVGGVLEVVPGKGGIRTVQGFGDVQLHIEWLSPVPARGTGQDRGNSGVFLMGRYEVQILDSYRNDTYPDGQAAAIYGDTPPLVNASRQPGRWQSFDIVFRRPHFRDGRLTVPARMTVFHNGILVHEDVVLQGATAHHQRPTYTPHADRLPITLQDHGHPVRFRNIWVRDLERSTP